MTNPDLTKEQTTSSSATEQILFEDKRFHLPSVLVTTNRVVITGDWLFPWGEKHTYPLAHIASVRIENSFLSAFGILVGWGLLVSFITSFKLYPEMHLDAYIWFRVGITIFVSCFLAANNCCKIWLDLGFERVTILRSSRKRGRTVAAAIHQAILLRGPRQGV